MSESETCEAPVLTAADWLRLADESEKKAAEYTKRAQDPEFCEGATGERLRHVAEMHKSSADSCRFMATYCVEKGGA